MVILTQLLSPEATREPIPDSSSCMLPLVSTDFLTGLYLASPLASYVSGIVLVVDGGSWMTFPNGIKQLLEFESFSAKL